MTTKFRIFGKTYTFKLIFSFFIFRRIWEILENVVILGILCVPALLFDRRILIFILEMYV